MGSDEYTAITGGTLKLKGVKDARITKPKKKKKTTGVDDEEKGKKSESAAGKDTALAEKSSRQKEIDQALADEMDKEEQEDQPAPGAGKTEAERRYEERRRKRVRLFSLLLGRSIRVYWPCALSKHVTDSGICDQLDERLKREGIKTHKERVEELNRYLSNLSEHHDMYVCLFILL